MHQAKDLKGLVWRKKNEDLIKYCTSKGNKAGHGCKVASSFAAISLRRAICYCMHYEKLCGKLFSEFIENNFIEISKSSCNTAVNVFVQDGDPIQKSKAANIFPDKIGTAQFSILPCSLDINPIENGFNLVEKKLSSDAFKYSISKESYAKFLERVENPPSRYPIVPIDNIIKSMRKRISQVIQSKCHRLKY